MSQAKRSRHQEVERDEVAETLQRFVDTFNRHRTRILWGAGIVVVVGALTLAWMGYRARMMREANNLVLAALSQYNQLLNQRDPDTREQIAAALVQNADQALQRAPRSALGRTALFAKGAALFAVDKVDEAQAAFEQALARARSDAERAQAEIALGYTLENAAFLTIIEETTGTQRRNLQRERLAKLAEAEAHYRRAAELAPRDSYLRHYAMLGQARIAELTSRNDEAVALLQRIIDEREPLAQTPDKAEPETGPDAEITRMVMQIVRAYESQIGLAATAKLRLERLQARMKQPSRTVAARAVAPETVARPADGATTASISVAETTATAATTPTASGMPPGR